ncbi:MAG: TIGR02646 family protein [Gammaproteobacteria bacterium]|jgi:uncharacterized protein (TIGR02646 family)|nr:TIGR02646 family protein [Gammaproteobacteria bacterium]
MRAITKGAAHYQLQQRHQNPPTTAEEATAAWGNFRGKAETRKRCIEEQYGLCGYSEVSLEGNASQVQGGDRPLGIHLEHVEPKSRNPARTFEHANLIACAIDNVKARGLGEGDIFGGHAKQSWYHPQDFIHPLLLGCRDYFHYQSSGRVVPTAGLMPGDRAKAELTIDNLNLNAPVLVVWRKTWLQQAEVIINELLDDPDALLHFAELELLPVNGRLRPFHSAQRALFGRVGEQVCAQHQPPL